MEQGTFNNFIRREEKSKNKTVHPP